MTRYNILVSKTALFQLNSLEASVKARVKTALESIGDDPFRSRPGSDIKRLVMSFDPPLYRLRVGDFRVIYEIPVPEEKFDAMLVAV